ncbi:MAG TPA: CoA transferase [Actinomycetota bacterium]
MAGPLEGVRVADFSRVLSGPYATMVLGDLGADVVKVERPGSGDESRGWGPPFAGGESAYYLSVNRNKRSVALDLARDDHRDAAMRLIESSQIVVENFRPGTMERLGLGFDVIAARNPRAVVCSISGFGLDGSDRDRPGYDFVVQGMGGVMSITGEPDGPPEKVGVAIADVTTGLFAVVAIQAALRRAEASGRGERVHVSLFGSQVAWLANQASNWLTGDVEPTRMGNRHPNIVPYQVFDAADGPFVLAVGNEVLWARFCGATSLDVLRDDPRYATNAARVANREELCARLAAMFAERPRAEWLALLARADVPAGPINSIREVFETPPGDALVEQIPHPTAGSLKLVRSPLDVAGVATRRPPPLLGEHTVEVLLGLGYGRDEAERMAES